MEKKTGHQVLKLVNCESTMDKPRNERSQEKVFWKTGGTEIGGHMVTLVWCLKGTLTRGRKWAAWVQTAEMSTISLSTDCWQSLTGSACGSRCLEQSDVIQQAENSPAMKNWPVPGQREKSYLCKKASSIRSEEHSSACLLMLTQ